MSFAIGLETHFMINEMVMFHSVSVDKLLLLLTSLSTMNQYVSTNVLYKLICLNKCTVSINMSQCMYI